MKLNDFVKDMRRWSYHDTLPSLKENKDHSLRWNFAFIKDKNETLRDNLSFVMYILSDYSNPILDSRPEDEKLTEYDYIMLGENKKARRYDGEGIVYIEGEEVGELDYIQYVIDAAKGETQCSPPFAVQDSCYDTSTLSQIPPALSCGIGVLPYVCSHLPDIQNHFTGFI
jgi:hypothetical protein